MELHTPATDKLRGLAHFLGLRRGMTGVLGMAVLVGMGEHMGERFLPLYLQELARGGTAVFAIGLLAGMDDLLSALYSYPGGWLSDRLGAKRALLVFNLLSMAGYALVIAVPTWWALLAGAALFISWSAISLPATMELVSAFVPRNKRAMGVSMHSLIRRVPKMLGPLLGGAFIAAFGVVDGVRLAFAAALVLALLALILQQTLIEDVPPREREPGQGGALSTLKAMRPELRSLLVADILVRFCERIPDAFVVLWATRVVSGEVTELEFGLLSAVESAVAMLVYVPVAYLADRSGKKPFVAVTFAFFTLFPLVLLFSRSFWPLLGAFVVRGLKEFGEPTRKALILDLSPEGAKAASFGVYYLVRDVVVSLAAFGGAGLWAISPEANLLTAFGFGVIGTAFFVARGRDLHGAAPRAT